MNDETPDPTEPTVWYVGENRPDGHGEWISTDPFEDFVLRLQHFIERYTDDETIQPASRDLVRALDQALETYKAAMRR